MGGLPIGEHRGLCSARNTVLRQERQLEKKAYTERLEAERLVHIQRQQEQEQLLKEHWVMIQRQANQLDELNQQLHGLRQLHLN
ncbi:hypothetical protein [Spirosoma endbachense]|uniref:hypothetical protein n=1 Tax=Spirosoma endbachense TaxID=2666025 RepID=UPI001E2B7EA9|nr:hypothetical protein [Spirosoma endbachense]